MIENGPTSGAHIVPKDVELLIFYFLIFISYVSLGKRQSLKKIAIGEHGDIWPSKWPIKTGFWAAQPRVWAEPKIFWVVPRAGLGVYKSTPKFGSSGSQGASRSHFQFYFIKMGPKLELG